MRAAQGNTRKVSASAGFTLIEVLVALAVVAISLPVVGSLLSTNIKGTIKVEQRVKLLAAYRTLESSLLDRSRLSPGPRSGEIDATKWRMEVRELGEDETGMRSAGPWVPLAIGTTLRTASGETFHIETIRLGRRGTP